MTEAPIDPLLVDICFVLSISTPHKLKDYSWPSIKKIKTKPKLKNSKERLIKAAALLSYTTYPAVWSRSLCSRAIAVLLLPLGGGGGEGGCHVFCTWKCEMQEGGLGRLPVGLHIPSPVKTEGPEEPDILAVLAGRRC